MTQPFFIFCGDLYAGYTLKVQGQDGVRKFQHLHEAVTTVRNEVQKGRGRLVILNATGGTTVDTTV